MKHLQLVKLVGGDAARKMVSGSEKYSTSGTLGGGSGEFPQSFNGPLNGGGLVREAGFGSGVEALKGLTDSVNSCHL